MLTLNDAASLCLTLSNSFAMLMKCWIASSLLVLSNENHYDWSIVHACSLSKLSRSWLSKLYNFVIWCTLVIDRVPFDARTFLLECQNNFVGFQSIFGVGNFSSEFPKR